MKLLIRSRQKIWSWKGVRVAKRNIFFRALPWSLHVFLTVVILIFSLRASFFFLVITWKTSKFLKIKKIKHFNTIFKGYFPFTVIIKYWQYSTCCIIHSWDYLTPNSLYSTPYCPSPLVTSLFLRSVSQLLFFVIFTTLLYCLDSTYKWYHTVFVFDLFATNSKMAFFLMRANLLLSHT